MKFTVILIILLFTSLIEAVRVRKKWRKKERKYTWRSHGPFRTGPTRLWTRKTRYTAPALPTSPPREQSPPEEFRLGVCASKQENTKY